MTTNQTTLASLHRDARTILAAALADCSIPAAFARALACNGRQLHRLRARSGPECLHLDDFPDIRIVAIGKAAVPMLDALLALLPDAPDLRGVCCAPARPALRHNGIQYFAGGHPLPNEDSFRAARAALDLLHSADEHTLVFFLISGGGSALFELPIDSNIPLEDTRRFHQILIGCGAPIAEINTLRKHFSAVKGGRLALAASRATQLSLLVSDVPLDQLDAIASGPTLPDRSTAAEVRKILDRRRLLEQFPLSVRRFFEHSLAQGPATHRNSPPPSRSYWELILSSDEFAQSSARHAAALGFHVVLDDHCDDWDYARSAQYLLRQLELARRDHPRCCLISVGEVTVQLNATPGAGGRNQQFALACAEHLQNAAPTVLVLSAGTDGIDGNTTAAGAIADATTCMRARSLHFDPETALREFNTHPLFVALGDTIVTGPTGNNLRDLRLLLATES